MSNSRLSGCLAVSSADFAGVAAAVVACCHEQNPRAGNYNNAHIDVPTPLQFCPSRSPAIKLNLYGNR